MEERNKKSTGVVVFLIILITAAAIFAVGVAKKNKKGGMPMGFGGARFVPSATSVKTVIAQNSVLHDYVVTNGEIETQKSIEVFPSMGGKVVEMKVSLGSPVKTGDVIAYVDPSEPGSYYAKSIAGTHQLFDNFDIVYTLWLGRRHHFAPALALGVFAVYGAGGLVQTFGLLFGVVGAHRFGIANPTSRKKYNLRLQ